jgi:putative oxygen-independent coproporphyrinogen III oxidase
VRIVFSQPDASEAKPSFEPVPRAAYVHVPFCRHRCGYCNFTLVAGRDDLIGDYLRALAVELAATRKAHEVDTLYFGGGTPTHLTTEQLRQLSKLVLERHPLGDNYEFTVEANPADVDPAMVETLLALGVTRVSLGGQSFRAAKLRLLERDHEAADIRRVVTTIHQAKMQVALDLIFATPGETLDEWAADLEAAIALEPNHVSTYGLTFEKGTAFWGRRVRGELVEADEELQRDMYALAIDRLTAAGYEQYEISNFARPGCRSRHNQVYWSGDGYFAYGPGASRYLNGIRETNHRSTTTYLHRVLAGESPVENREELSLEARARELLVFGLRRLDGVSRSQFRVRAGFECDDLVATPLRKFIDLGLLADNGEQIRLTREGLFVSDAMWPEML